MSAVLSNENKVDMINYVTIPIWEYRELLTKVARYELLQEQERQREAEMEAFRAGMAKDMAKIGDTEKPVPVTVTKSEKVEKAPAPAKKAKPAISTEINEK